MTDFKVKNTKILPCWEVEPRAKTAKYLDLENSFEDDTWKQWSQGTLDMQRNDQQLQNTDKLSNF